MRTWNFTDYWAYGEKVRKDVNQAIPISKEFVCCCRLSEPQILILFFKNVRMLSSAGSACGLRTGPRRRWFHACAAGSRPTASTLTRKSRIKKNKNKKIKNWEIIFSNYIFKTAGFPRLFVFVFVCLFAFVFVFVCVISFFFLPKILHRKRGDRVRGRQRDVTRVGPLLEDALRQDWRVTCSPSCPLCSFLVGNIFGLRRLWPPAETAHTDVNKKIAVSPTHSHQAALVAVDVAGAGRKV